MADFAKKYDEPTKTVVFAALNPKGKRVLDDLLGWGITKVQVQRGPNAEMFEEEIKRQPPYDIEILDLDLLEILGK